LKKANPGFPILIRECSNVTPKVYARYGRAYNYQKNIYSIFLCISSNIACLIDSGFGKENSVVLSNKGSDEVGRAIQSLSQQ